MAVLWMGWRKARTTGGVITYAIVAAILFAVHLFILLLWSMGAGFSGTSGFERKAFFTVAMAAGILEIGFLCVMLSRIRGKPRGR